MTCDNYILIKASYYQNGFYDIRLKAHMFHHINYDSATNRTSWSILWSFGINKWSCITFFPFFWWYLTRLSLFLGWCTWWRHQMETFSALLAIRAGNSPVFGEFPAQRPVTRSFDVFFDCTWINRWVNNDESGDFRRYRTHYDVIVMVWLNLLYRYFHRHVWSLHIDGNIFCCLHLVKFITVRKYKDHVLLVQEYLKK